MRKPPERGFRLLVARVRSHYWRPNTNLVEEVVRALRGKLKDGDIVAVSEKALATAMGRVVDESEVRASSLAKAIASIWMRVVWGYLLGPLCRLKPFNLARLRAYPPDLGAKHKEVALKYAGFLQALRHYSEGGIDASNLPFSLVALPLEDPAAIAEELRTAIARRLKRHVTVMIVDGDSTFSAGPLHLAPRPVRVKGLLHFGGFLTFVIGRLLRMKERATPLAIAGEDLPPNFALRVAELAHKAMGEGAGATVWDAAAKFDTDLAGISWEMLESVVHYPIAIVRRVAAEPTKS